MSSSTWAERRSAHREAFWTLAVGAPAALSVLRLWVESGGELQTTLLLVSNVGPLNLAAALFATATQLVTVVLIALFMTGGTVRATTAAEDENLAEREPEPADDTATEAAGAAPYGNSVRKQPPMVARVTAAAPTWFVVATFLLAVLTWKIVFLPLLVPAAVATFQRPLWRLASHHLPTAVVLCCAAFAGYYGWLAWPAIRDAWAAHEWWIAALIALPPLVALGIDGPLPARLGRLVTLAAQPAILALAVLVGWAALHTPILPLVVTQVRTDDGTELLRGHVVRVDDAYLVLLQEQGGVRYLPTDEVGATVMCATPQEVPAFTTRVHDYHVEDSLLSAIGRHMRPRMQVDPLCRITQTALKWPSPPAVQSPPAADKGQASKGDPDVG